jgi:phosphocarrier protein HPr
MLDARCSMSGIQHRASRMSTPIKCVLKIKNSQGLHARPAQMFARLAYKFKCRLDVVYGTQRVDARSPMELLTLGVHPGNEIILEAEGEDAEQAVEALANLVDSDFPIEKADNEQEKSSDEL